MAAVLNPRTLLEHIDRALKARGANREFYLDLPDVPSHITYGALTDIPVDYIYVAPDGSLRLFDQADQGHELEEQSPELLQKILDNIQATTSPTGHGLL